MEGANVPHIGAIELFNKDKREKWAQWYEASFRPVVMSTGNFLGIDWCKPTTGSKPGFQPSNINGTSAINLLSAGGSNGRR